MIIRLLCLCSWFWRVPYAYSCMAERGLSHLTKICCFARSKNRMSIVMITQWQRVNPREKLRVTPSMPRPSKSRTYPEAVWVPGIPPPPPKHPDIKDTRPIMTNMYTKRCFINFCTSRVFMWLHCFAYHRAYQFGSVCHAPTSKQWSQGLPGLT